MPMLWSGLLGATLGFLFSWALYNAITPEPRKHFLKVLLGRTP